MKEENASTLSALTAVETTGFAADRISGIVAAGETEQPDDSAQLQPPDVAPPTAELSEPPAWYGLLPHLGKCWENVPGTNLPGKGSWLELVAVTSYDHVQVCEYSQKDGDDSWVVIHWPEAIARALIPKELVEFDAMPAWAVKLHSMRLEAFGEGIIGTEGEVAITPEPVPEPPAEQLDAKGKQLLSVGMHCCEIANELDLDALHVMRLLDGLVQTVAQFIALKELASSTPVIPAVFTRFLSPKAREYLMNVVAGMANGPIRNTINAAAQDAVDDFEAKLEEASERLAELAKQLEEETDKATNELENETKAADASTDAVAEALAKLELSNASMWNDVQRALGTLEGQEELLGDKLDPINKDLSTLEQRMNEVQPDWKPQGKKAGKAKPSQPPKGAKADFFQTSRAELDAQYKQGKVKAVEFDEEEEDLDDDDHDLDDQDPLEDLDDDDDEEEEESTARSASRRPPPKPSKAPPKPPVAPPKRGPGRPKKVAVRPRGNLDPTPRPRKHIKKARGRAAVLKRQNMPPVDNRPLAGKVPTTAGLRQIDEFMGRKKDRKIRVLLSKIPSAKLAKFLEDSKKGSFNMTVTGWDIREQSAFVKWFFARR